MYNPLSLDSKNLIQDIRHLWNNRHKFPESRATKLKIMRGLVSALRKVRKRDGLLF